MPVRHKTFRGHDVTVGITQIHCQLLLGKNIVISAVYSVSDSHEANRIAGMVYGKVGKYFSRFSLIRLFFAGCVQIRVRQQKV